MTTLRILELETNVRPVEIDSTRDRINSDTPPTYEPRVVYVCVSTHGAVAARCVRDRIGTSELRSARFESVWRFASVRVRGGMDDMIDAVALDDGVIAGVVLTRPRQIVAYRLWLFRNDPLVDGEPIRSELCESRHR